MWNGEKIYVELIENELPQSVDTEANLEKVRDWYLNKIKKLNS